MARKNRLPVQQFRGSDKEHDTYTGPVGEITVCSTDWSLRVHDGKNKGGLRVVPVGTIALYPVQNVPLGWVPCNGAELDQVQYYALYRICGTKYGNASAGKFKVPDLTSSSFTTSSKVYFMIKAI